MRAFLAVDIPDAARSALAALQRELASAGADVKWVAAEQLHLTLKFLGEISDEQRRAAEALLATVAREVVPFVVRLEGVGAFPSAGAPRVIWVGLAEGHEPLMRVATAIEQGGAALSLPKEERALTPHLTIGRVRSPRGRRALSHRLQATRWPPPPPWHVTALRCYQSVLSPTGPAYTVLADIPLSGAGGA